MRDVEALVERQPPLFHDLVDGQPLEVLEDEVEDSLREADVAFVGDADVVDRDDVRVIQAGDGARLVHEAAAHLRVVGERDRQDLDGDLPAERRIRAEVNLSHAAAPEEAATW